MKGGGAGQSFPPDQPHCVAIVPRRIRYLQAGTSIILSNADFKSYITDALPNKAIGLGPVPEQVAEALASPWGDLMVAKETVITTLAQSSRYC